jgi:two-component system, NtrC family, sensor kinase
LQKLLRRLVGLRLQRVLAIGFVLTTAITILISTPITYRVINGYLAGAQDARVGRDMNLAEAFYELKLNDISSTALRLAAEPGIQNNMSSAGQGNYDPLLVQELEAEMHNEFSVVPAGTRRFVVAVDAQGRAIAGRSCCKDEQLHFAIPNADWSELPIVKDVLATGQPQAATEVIPADMLSWVYLDEQARIALEKTPKAAPQPFDGREGTGGLTVMGVAPVKPPDGSGRVVGAIIVSHLINNDFTLVDRIKEVAGVDTATVFFGDLRVSTNVLKENGQRAIGTMVSQEVYDRVLLQGQEFTGPAYVVNQWYISRYRPLKDHLGQIVGILYVGAKQSTFRSLVDSFGRQVFLIAGASILLSALIAIPVARSISRPLSDLAQATHQVAEGDWSVRVPVYGHGEMGTLAESFNTMVETLRDTNDQLVQKEKLASVGQLAAGVAHEINNPLGSVLLYADILCRETPHDNTQQRDDLTMIIKEATRCKTIVTDLLNFSRQNEVLAQKTDLTTLLQELVEEVSKKQQYAKVKLTTVLDPSLPPIEADPLQLRQAFLNLMNNGAEAMTEGGELALRARKGPNAGFVTVEVQDTGIGISEENMKKLFTPFFTTKPIGKGTGLGLAITYGIVKMHQGQINVQSQIGKGTTFTVTLREKLPAQEKGAFVGQ